MHSLMTRRKLDRWYRLRCRSRGRDSWLSVHCYLASRERQHSGALRANKQTHGSFGQRHWWASWRGHCLSVWFTPTRAPWAKANHA